MNQKIRLVFFKKNVITVHIIHATHIYTTYKVITVHIIHATHIYTTYKVIE